MSGIAGAINTALSGLELFDAGINAVSNNLANQATPGYTVESVTASTQDGPVGQPGDGVQPAVVARAASGFAAAQLRNANAASAAATAQATNPVTMGALRTMVAPTQIVFGSDYPYRTSPDQFANLQKLFDAKTMEMIGGGNAQKILQHWA